MASVLARLVRFGVQNVERGLDSTLFVIPATIQADICIEETEFGHARGVATGEGTLSLFDWFYYGIELFRLHIGEPLFFFKI